MHNSSKILGLGFLLMPSLMAHPGGIDGKQKARVERTLRDIMQKLCSWDHFWNIYIIEN